MLADCTQTKRFSTSKLISKLTEWCRHEGNNKLSANSMPRNRQSSSIGRRRRSMQFTRTSNIMDTNPMNTTSINLATIINCHCRRRSRSRLAAIMCFLAVPIIILNWIVFSQATQGHNLQVLSISGGSGKTHWPPKIDTAASSSRNRTIATDLTTTHQISGSEMIRSSNHIANDDGHLGNLLNLASISSTTSSNTGNKTNDNDTILNFSDSNNAKIAAITTYFASNNLTTSNVNHSAFSASLQSNLINTNTNTNNNLLFNSNDTNGAPHDTTEDDRPLIFGIIIANIIIFVIGFCGNVIVILVILKFTKIETVTDIYILNLAFADLMFILGLVFLIITMFIDHWIFGNLMCKLYMASTSLNQFASSLLLVVMSFDRFLAVCHPIYAQRFRRLRRAKVICLCIWITCLILMIPIFAFAKTNHDLTCAIFWPDYKSFNCEIAFTLCSFAIGFAVPLLLIAAFYICVIRKLRLAASGPIGLGSSRRSRSRETTNKRIEHLVIGIICTYTVCWLPYWLTQLCVSFMTTLEIPPIEGFYSIVLISTCLSYTNSALNPILYAFLSDNFKRRCSEVFRSITSIKWCQVSSQCTDANSVATTTVYYETTSLDHHNHNHNHHNQQLHPAHNSTCKTISNNACNNNLSNNRQESRIKPTDDNGKAVDSNSYHRLIARPNNNIDICTRSISSDRPNNNNNNNGDLCSQMQATTKLDKCEFEGHEENIGLVPLMIQSISPIRTIEPTVLSTTSTGHLNDQRLDLDCCKADIPTTTTTTSTRLEQTSPVSNVCSPAKATCSSNQQISAGNNHRKKSVNFSVDTFVVQGANNETVKGNDSKMLKLDKSSRCHGV